ncbi:hypothetical protein F0562_029493 [Nyssa sinensis]|uniref:P-type Ca(2+) transporter n=1 Tax=Nyssa sinensis TaxID=561372 RepID=A0A5J5B173_9ASTE|nr:hypothetical protein F0562_029493 [Nyssa sinensis]
MPSFSGPSLDWPASYDVLLFGAVGNGVSVDSSPALHNMAIYVCVFKEQCFSNGDPTQIWVLGIGSSYCLSESFWVFSFSAESPTPKNVQVAVQAKWSGTPLLLEAGELLSKEWKNFFFVEFIELCLHTENEDADSYTAKDCLKKIIKYGQSLFSEPLASVFEFSLTLRSASPRLVLYRQLAKESVSSFPLTEDVNANSVSGGISKINENMESKKVEPLLVGMNPSSPGGKCCWVDTGGALFFFMLQNWWHGYAANELAGDSFQPLELALEVMAFRDYLLSSTVTDTLDVWELKDLGRQTAQRIVQASDPLQRKAHVVAVTGDGTDDAPALKEADVGLPMGIQGTEVAKESSDIVILDDNFTSVVTVLKWGRCVYNNIQKFIQFQLTVNVTALVINFIAACSAVEVPLTAVQLLWVNLIMDTLGALALATERPTDELMWMPPIGRTEPLVTNVMWRNLTFHALYQIAILLALQLKGRSIFKVSETVKNTPIFNTFVLRQVFNEFNARRLERKNAFTGILRNRLFLSIVAIIIVLQVAMVEFLQKFANTERLNWLQWIICIVLAAVSWPLGWVAKCIPVPEKPFLSYVNWKS